MPRYFLAFDLSEPIKDRLVSLQPADLTDARLVERDQMHVTLHFLGELDDARRSETGSALATVMAPAFSLTLNGVGQFPPEGEPRYLWVGINDGGSLRSLHDQLASALTPSGFRPEDRPYTPHVTLVRFNSSPPEAVATDFLLRHRLFQSEQFSVPQFALYSSELTAAGPVYRQEQVFRLQ